MHNDPELSGKYLGKITQDFVKIADLLSEACYQMRARDISAFPVVTFSKDPVPFAATLLDKGHDGIQWFVGLTMLEALLESGMVDVEKKEEFIQAYKPPDEYCCMFVLDIDFIHFVYIPYPED